MKARVAMFRWARWPDWRPSARAEHECTDDDTDHVRCTGWVEIEFPDLTGDALIAARLGVLTTEREQTVAKFTKELKRIDESIAELRALPNPDIPSSSEADERESVAP
jgi:hypothetical protein